MSESDKEHHVEDDDVGYYEKIDDGICLQADRNKTYVNFDFNDYNYDVGRDGDLFVAANNDTDYKLGIHVKSKRTYCNIRRLPFTAKRLANSPTAMFHACDMKYNNISDNLLEILSSNGITHVQISPAQNILEKNDIDNPDFFENGPETKMMWKLAYIPINMNLGNYYGSVEDIKSLVTRAHHYKIKVICEIAIQHVAPTSFEYSEPRKWHDFFKKCEETKNRFSTLRQCIEKNRDSVLLERIKKRILSFYGLKNNEWSFFNENMYIDAPNDKKEMYKNDANRLYNTFTIPTWCYTEHAYFSWKCWVNNLHPQLNHDFPPVRYEIKKMLNEYAKIGLDGIRIYHAHTIEPYYLKRYMDYFNKRHAFYNSKDNIINDADKPFNYIEFVSTGNGSVCLHDRLYYEIFPTTDLKILSKYKEMLFEDNDKLTHFLSICGDNGIVMGCSYNFELGIRVFETLTNDEHINMMYVILIQRIFNIPLIYKTRIKDNRIMEACRFRKYLRENGANVEKNKINDGIFTSEKYKDSKLLGTFYMNITVWNKTIDKNHTLRPGGIFIKKN